MLRDVRQPEEGEDENQVFQFYLDDREIKSSIQDILIRIHSSKVMAAQEKKKLFTPELECWAFLYGFCEKKFEKKFKVLLYRECRYGVWRTVDFFFLKN